MRAPRSFTASIPILELQVSLSDDNIFFLGPGNGVSQFHEQPLTGHLQKAQAGLSRRKLKVTVHIPRV